MEALVGRLLRVLWKRARRTWEVVLGGRRGVGWRVVMVGVVGGMVLMRKWDDGVEAAVGIDICGGWRGLGVY